MSSPEQYPPGATLGAEVRKDGATWTLVVRDLAHPPEKVLKALTDPEHLRERAPLWQRLNADYAKQFGVATPGWS